MDRIESTLAQLTLAEKVAMVSGSGPWHSTAVERVGVPRFKMTDGPNAARGEGGGARAACFPVGVALAASWNPELVRAVGAALGDEAKTKGAQVLLGPTINIQRTPIGGRNFECYSEDPHLTGTLASAFVRGVQSEGVAACVKHFACNDTEFERHSVSANVDERTLREIYLRPFERAVRDAGAWSVMSAYNRINGVYASSHRELLLDVLKGEWGFDGVVISDWGASLHTVENANGGLDLEMPGPARTRGERLVKAVREGDVPERAVDDKVRRLLRLMQRTGRLDAPDEVSERTDDTPAKRALARRAAIEGSVLLKNEPSAATGRPVLPLDARALRRMAVIGPNAEIGRVQGGGSASAPPHHEVHPLDAIRCRLGNGVEVQHAVGCLTHKFLPPFPADQLDPGRGSGPGFAIDYFAGTQLAGEPILERVSRRSKLAWFQASAGDFRGGPFSARLSADFTPAASGVHTFGLTSAGQSRLLLDGALLIDNWTDQTPGESFFSSGSTEVRAEAALEAGRVVRVEIEFARQTGQRLAGLQYGVLPPGPADPIADAVALAAACDAVVLVAGTNDDWETEGNDRSEMALPGDQAQLIERVCAANANTVVVLNAGSPVDTDWWDAAPAALQVWFPGQEFGDALCDVLFGAANPSGKLPLSFPRRLEDTPAYAHYPGRDGQLDYAEGLLVGYRWYDTRGIAPRLPFGHGLSYTTFEYGPLEVEGVDAARQEARVALDVTNSGTRAGAEVVQLYARDLAASVPRPHQELVAFEKVELAPGERTRVTFALERRQFAFWDTARHAWRVEPGAFELCAGSSSRDHRARATIEL